MSVLFISLLSTFLVLCITWYFSRRYPKSPPGPIGLPILGSLLSLNPETPHYSLTEIARKYGKNGACQLFLGTIRTVLLTDPKLIREAFARDEFAGRAPLFLTHGIMKGQGIICAEGDLWKDQRRLLSLWLRSMGAAKTSSNREELEAKVSKHIDHMMKYLDSRVSQEPVNVHTMLADNIGNLISQLVLGVSFHDQDETWNWLLETQEEGTKAMGVAAIVNFLPFIRFFSSSTKKIMDFLISGQMQTHTIYMSIINLRRNMKRRKAGENVEDYNEQISCIHYGPGGGKIKSHNFHTKDLIVSEEDCVLDYYLDEQKARENNDPKGAATERLSDIQLTYLLGDLFGAGLDTTLVTLSWFLLFVTINKDEQVKIRDELKNHCGSYEPSLTDFPHLPYIRAAISETQRIRSVVPVGIPHGCLKDMMIGEYLIKKGTMVVPLQWAVHTDEGCWNEPIKFNPSRFIDDYGNYYNPTHFIPFQTGKRMCPGDELARIILFKFAARLIQRYDLELVEPIPSLEGVMGLTMAPAPYKLKFNRIRND